MNGTSTQTVLSAEQLISNFPLFCLLSPEEIHYLALSAKEIDFKQGEAIVYEGEVLDSFYFIKSGTAEVTKTLVTIGKKQNIHLAFLKEGDAIGLNELGFFSSTASTGIRTATVTAQCPMILIHIDITLFDAFLKSVEQLYPALKNSSEQILFMLFLKKSIMFQEVTHYEIRRLAANANKQSIKAGEVFFKEGDPTNACYFLLTGEITVFTTQDNKKTVLNEIRAPNLIGEAAFLSQGTRHASAEAKTDCKMILIKMKDIEQIMKAHKLLFNALSLLSIEQIKPQKKEDIIVQDRAIFDKQFPVILRNASHNKVFLTDQEYLIWKELNGRTPLLNIRKKIIFLSIEEIYAFIIKMTRAGFLEEYEIESIKSISGVKQHINKFIFIIKTMWK